MTIFKQFSNVEKLSYIKILMEEEGWKLLSTEYVNESSKLNTICSNGHKLKINWFCFNQGQRCKKCARIRMSQDTKKNIQDIRNIMEQEEWYLISTEYKNNKTKLKTICPNNHLVEITWHDFDQGKRCRKCAFEKLAIHNRLYTIEDVRRHIENLGGQLLSTTYLNVIDPIIVKCLKCNCEWDTCFCRIKNEHWCPKCVNCLPLSLKIAQEEAFKRGGKCLALNYINSGTKMLFECSKGHLFKVALKDIRCANRWCKECNTSKSERICRLLFETIFDRKFPSLYPKWLISVRGNRLELDGYCEELGVAFEHNGTQHYDSNSFEQSEEAFQYLQECDQLKLKLCKANNVKLIIIKELFRRLKLSDLKKTVKEECLKLNINLPTDYDQIEVNYGLIYK